MDEKAIIEVMTIGEASEVWNKSQATLKSACAGQKGLPPRFTDDECRKSKGTWLVTREGMTRLYGEPPTQTK